VGEPRSANRMTITPAGYLQFFVWYKSQSGCSSEHANCVHPSSAVTPLLNYSNEDASYCVLFHALPTVVIYSCCVLTPDNWATLNTGHLVIQVPTDSSRGKRGHSYLRHCATNRKVAVKFPMVSLIFFIDIIFPHYGLGFDSGCNRNISLGVKAAGA